MTLRYTRVFPYPLDVAFAWLTDYQDDDPSRTDRVVVKRDVVERTPGRVVVDATVDTIGTWRGKAEILIFPPNRWEARPMTRTSGTVYAYRLDPHPDGCRLTVDYTLAIRKPWKRLLARALRPFALRKIGRMWDGFADAMARELPPTARVKAVRGAPGAPQP